MKITKLNFGHLAALVLCNNFYLNALLNYKVLYILGIVFLTRKLRIRWILFLIFFCILQLEIIYHNSPVIKGDLRFLALSLLQFIGMIGWIRVIIKNGYLAINPVLVIFITGLSTVIPSTILNIDILLAAIFAFFGFHKRSSIPFDIVNIIISIIIGWRAATIAILSGIVTKIWMTHKQVLKITYRIIILGSITFMVMSLTQVLSTLYLILLSSGTAFDPTSGRLVMWIYSYQFWLDGIMNLRPQAFFGYGYNYPSHLFAGNGSLSVEVSVLGLDIESSKNTADKTRLHLHNFILQNLIEFGLVGVFIQLYITLNLFKMKGKIAILTTVGLAAGVFASVFYVYSPYFMLLFMAMRHSKQQKLDILKIEAKLTQKKSPKTMLI